MSRPEAWTVTARNLPEHARNAIHTDAGAQAAGFPRALVAGVTTYAYLTHPLAAGWGLAWLSGGGGEVRFRSPVFEHDDVRCEEYDPAEPDEMGVPWNDPRVAHLWHTKAPILSARDLSAAS